MRQCSEIRTNFAWLSLDIFLGVSGWGEYIIARNYYYDSMMMYKTDRWFLGGLW